MNCRFSVIIPLYNKQAEIAATIESVLAQSFQPLEIVIVNDGSTDDSAMVVRSFDSPLIRLITQTNAGECAARNRAMEQAQGDYFALLDADDMWKPDYLANMARLIDTYPDCGIYCSGFDIISAEGIFPGNSPKIEGVVENFFKESLTSYVTIPSAATISREVIDKVGGFPVGMRMGGDQYMWLKIVTAGFRVCFTPLRLTDYSTVAANRSGAIFRPEQTEFRLEDFYLEGDFYRNEYLAKVDLNKAITIASKGAVEYGKRAEKFYSYTTLNRRALSKLKIINRLPLSWRPTFYWAYSRAAWLIAKKGL